VSGCNNHYKFVKGAGTKVEERSDEIPQGGAKTVTSLLIIAPSVLLAGFIFLLVFLFQI